MLSAYRFTYEISGEEINLLVKQPEVADIHELVYNTNYEKQKAFLLKNATAESGNIESVIDEYPGLVESFSKDIIDDFSLRKEHDKINKLWKKWDKELGESAMALLNMLDKPKTNENIALAIMFMDALHCLRHLRRAYTAK